MREGGLKNLCRWLPINFGNPRCVHKNQARLCRAQPHMLSEPVHAGQQHQQGQESAPSKTQLLNSNTFNMYSMGLSLSLVIMNLSGTWNNMRYKRKKLNSSSFSGSTTFEKASVFYLSLVVKLDAHRHAQAHKIILKFQAKMIC